MTPEMARCRWGAKKTQMAVELGGRGTAKVNQELAGGSTVGHKPEPCKAGAALLWGARPRCRQLF